MKKEIIEIINKAIGEDKEITGNHLKRLLKSEHNALLSEMRAKVPAMAEAIIELIKNEDDHEMRKLLDGFSHPKDCEECNLLKK
jgi:Ni,Fe-hydrogenase maturation factor